MIGRLTGRLAAKAPDQRPARRRRRRLPRPHSALDLLRAAGGGEPGVALDPHARPRGHARALRLPDRARAGAFPAAAERGGDRPAGRADGPLGHAAVRARRRAPAAGRAAPRRDPGRRQEDGRAHGPGARREGRRPGRASPRQARPPPSPPTTSSRPSSTSATARPRPSAPSRRSPESERPRTSALT